MRGIHLRCMVHPTPAAAPTDADWGSAINIGEVRCQPGQWQTFEGEDSTGKLPVI
jgi:hypothetical protein